MSFWQFADSSPWCAFFIVLVIALTIESVITMCVRHLNIRKAGWPPAYLDADGDPRKEPK